MKKVIITRACEVSPDVRVEKIADALSSLGHGVNVLGWNRGVKLCAQESRSFGTIRRFDIPAGYGQGMKLLPKMLWFWVRIFVYLIRQSFDVVHACDFDTLPPALLAAKLKRKKIVYDIFDFYAEGGSVPARLRPIIRFIDKLLMHFADTVIVVDEVRLPYLPKADSLRAKIIYNTPNDVFGKQQLSPVPAALGKGTRFRVVYSGNLIERRYILELAEAVSRTEGTEMIIAGFGPKEFVDQVIAKCSEYNNVRYIGKLTVPESLALVSTADTVFSLNDPAIPNNRMSSPNKMFEAMMMAKPVVVNRWTSMEDKILAINCGVVIDDCEPDSLAGALRQLVADPDLARQMGENGRRAFTEKYDWKFMIEKLAKIYA